MKVKAAIARSHGAPLSLEGLELDQPQADEILVKLIASGVAHVDLDAIDGRLPIPLPFVPGAEGAGIVERVGASVTELAPGDSVIVGFDFCGHCEHCATGHPRACVDFAALNLSGRRHGSPAPFTEDGHEVNGRFFGQSSFATHLLCRAACAVKVATDAPLEVLACLGGELLLGAGLILHGFALKPGDSLVVVGADAIGLVAIMVAKAQGAKVIVVADPDEHRRVLASQLGADVALHGIDDLPDLVKSLVADGARFALETTGDPAARAACIASLAKGGTVALVDPPLGTSLDFEDQMTEGRPLVLSVDGHAPPAILIPELVALHLKGVLPLEQLVDFFAFEHVNDALDALRAHTVVKPVLRFSLGGFGDLDRALVEGAADEEPTEDGPVEAPAEDIAPIEQPALVRS